MTAGAISLIVFLGIASFGVGVAELKLAQELVRFRRDVGPKGSWTEGRSIFPQFNVSDPANYTPEGLPGLRRLKRLALIRASLMALAAMVFVGTFVID